MGLTAFNLRRRLSAGVQNSSDGGRGPSAIPENPASESKGQSEPEKKDKPDQKPKGERKAEKKPEPDKGKGDDLS